MASKSELSNLNVSKNRENSERRRPSIHFVDLSDTLVFTKEELEKELAKIPEQKLRTDEDGILSRTSNVRRAPSLVTPGDLMDTGHLESGRRRKRASPRSLDSDNGGSLDRRRKRQSSTLSVASSTSGLIKSHSSSDIHRHSPEARSFYELIQATSKMKIEDKYPEEEFPYPDPIPIEMRFLDMKDLIATNIDWKMLTMKRPVSKIDEEYFSRVVEMKRLEHKTKLEDGYGLRRTAFKLTRHPRTMYKYRSHDSDILDFETIIPDVDYESYARDDPDENQVNVDQVENANELVAKLLGDDFSDNFTSGKDRELAENVRRKSSVKKVAKSLKNPGGGFTSPSPVQRSLTPLKKEPAQSTSRPIRKNEVRSKSRTDSPLPASVTKLNPKAKSLNSKPSSTRGNLTKRTPTTRGTKSGQATKKDKIEVGKNVTQDTERKEDEKMEMNEVEEEKNRFANTWIDATKEKGAPKIVVTGTLPGE